MCPDVGNIKSLIMLSAGCAETGTKKKVREIRYTNIKVKIIQKN